MDMQKAYRLPQKDDGSNNNRSSNNISCNNSTQASNLTIHFNLQRIKDKVHA